MPEEFDLMNLSLYLLNHVRIMLKNGDVVFGEMKNLSPQTNTIVLEEEEYAVSQLQDIALVGKVTDYHTWKGVGEIGNFTFSLEDLTDSFLQDAILYGEFDCTVTCHLKLEDGKIRAKDIGMLSYSHRLYEPILEQEYYLYRFADGAFCVGKLEKGENGGRALRKRDDSVCPLDPAAVTEIVKAPSINDFVYVTLQDGTQVSGLVSASTDTMAVLIGESAFMVNFENMRALRYRGSISISTIAQNGMKQVRIATGSRNAGTFLCKKPYFQDPDQMDVLAEGDVASFVPGVTDRGLIAKDIRIEIPNEREEKPEKEAVGKGIILFLPNLSPNGGSGFIGKEYVAKSYAKLFHQEMRQGDVSFTADQIEFNCKPGNIYVVSYTYVEDPERPVRRARHVSLERTYPYADYAKVWIDEKGEVNTLSFSVAYLEKWAGNDVELLLTDGSLAAGYLEECTKTEAVLLVTADGESVRRTIARDAVAQARFYGIITSYRTDNGTGHIGGEFWFHINSLKDFNEAPHVGAGKKVSFTLEQTSKGKLCAAKDISLVAEEVERGFLIGYDGVTCQIVSDVNDRGIKEPEAYPVTALRSNISAKLGYLSLSQYDYPILYFYRRNGLKTYIVITHVDSNDPRPKVFSGYVLKYVAKPQGTGFGFILPPEELEQHLKEDDRTGKIYFRQADVLNESEFKLNTRSCYYHVSYQMGGDKNAKNVRILEKHEFVKEKPAPEEPKPAKPVKPAKPPVPETIDLQKLQRDDGLYGEKTPAFGLVNICSSHYALINNCYINKKFAAEESYAADKPAVMFDPGHADIRNEPNMKTGKYCYLVRYVPEGTTVNIKTGVEHPTIDYAYPVEVLQSFAKNQCVRITIEEDMLTIEKAENAAQPQNPSPSQSGLFDVPDISGGESVLFEKADSSVEFYTFRGTEEGYYLVDDRLRIPKDAVVKIYRFGVVTDFNMEKGVATINRLMDFTLGAADPKVINILKSQTKVTRLHVIFACEENHIVEVLRVTDAYSRLVKWEEGIVTQCDASRKSITIDNRATHYISVLSDGLVSRSFKSNALENQNVFVKLVSHIWLNDDGTGICPAVSAVEIRCRTENATIQYDTGRDLYLGYRNPTFFYPVYGSAALLAQCDGRETVIVFRPGQDGYDLEARLEDDLADEASEENLEELENESATLESALKENLVRFCLQQVDLSRMFLKGVLLNEKGMPADREQAQRAFDILHGQPGDMSSIAAARIASEYEEVELEKRGDSENRGNRNSQIGRLVINAFQKRCRKLGLDSNFLPGEHAYYLSILMRYPSKRGGRRTGAQLDWLYQLFLQDFGSREELGNYLNKGGAADKKKLSALLSGKCRQMNELISHIMLLDQKSMESVGGMLESNAGLSSEILRHAVQIDDTVRSETLQETLQALRERYRRDKNRFTSSLDNILRTGRVCAEVRELILHMQARFLKLAGSDDNDRFERLLMACSRICDYSNRPGFSQQEQLLLQAYREINELEEEIIAHPCRESTEMLMMCRDAASGETVFAKLRAEVETLLNRLYQDENAVPQILCVPNEEMIEKGQNTFWLIVRNGTKNLNLQPADNVSILLESYTEGVSVSKKTDIGQKHLAAGEQIPVEIKFFADEGNLGSVTIGWSVEYEYSIAFDRGSTRKARVVQDQGSYFELQHGVNRQVNKRTGVENPYLEAAQGQPLEDRKMFFGRETESREIRNSIIRMTEQGETFIPGSAVIVHGQKKSGKTSLVYQIKNDIKENAVLRKKAIMLNFNNILDEIGGVELLSCFKRTFYANILTRFENEIYENHPGVAALLQENSLKIPNLFDPQNNETWAALFDRFFREFFRIDRSEHVILLFMDEFTLLCTTITKEIQRNPENASLATIPNFIKTFSQYGFVQVIIGHEAMMRAFDSLGVLNHTAEFAKSVEIAALDHTASVRLVKEPMQEAFGYDVYETELGKRAVERLLDLSGCNPTYLMRLCSKMFDYFADDTCTRSQLLISDVDAMVARFINELLLTDFDILLVEDGDDAEDPEKRKTYQYLKSAAFQSSYSFDGRTADINQIKRELMEDFGYGTEVIERIRNLLEARRVISITSGGRVKINTGLFLEFILLKNGGK